MRHLADFLRTQRDAIVETWLDAVASLPSATRLGRAVVRNSMPHMIDEVARTLGSEVSLGAAVDSVAIAHAKQRFAHGYDLREVITEYQLLRRAIVERYASEARDLEQDVRSHVFAVAQLDAILDAAVADAIDGFIVERDRARDLFLSILGHDLRGPLQALLVGCDSMVERSESLGPELVRKMGVRMGASGRRMAMMIHDLLDFTRAHMGGGIPIALGPVDLHDVIDDVVEELSIAHPNRVIEVRTSDDGGGLRGEWDRERVAQALANLVGNAIQHGRDPIVVEGRGRASSIGLEVSSGGAIDADLVGQIFRPFSRVREVSAGGSAKGGLGLGLYIVAEIARAHGGRVEAAVVDGDRSRFAICLPRQVPG
jgi:signal transduction histidine kinase